MTPNAIRWEVPPLTTTSVEAAIHYRDGIAALVAGIASADQQLLAATTIDPGFLLAHIGRAVADATGGAPYVPPPTSSSLVTRGERQHAEIVAVTLCGDVHRARDLRREHLLEFPGDLLIVWLPMLARPGGG
ncbi:MAG: hypothetical protein ABW219_07125 [Ilumatobacteraceae bacterium]